MIDKKIKIVAPDAQNREIMNTCKKLWENNFDDTAKYVKYYFDDRWKESITFLCDDKSMLHLNPYDIKLFGEKKTIFYIVGVCTDKEYRHKGYMDFMLKTVFGKLYNENVPFVYLMPASEKIYTPYGFRGMYNVTSFKALKKDDCGKVYNDCIESCDIKEFDDLSKREKIELSNYAAMKLEREFECFVDRDNSYFEHKNKEMKACEGSVLILMRDGEVMGYAMYLCEDEPEVVEIVADKEDTDIFVEKLFDYAANDTENKAAEMKIIFDESYFIKEQNKSFAFFISEENTGKMLMARIIDIRAFVGMIKLKGCAEEYYIEITDDFIKENNGRWDIILSDKSVIKRGKSDENKYQKLTIAEFEDILFSKIKFYLNEMV